MPDDGPETVSARPMRAEATFSMLTTALVPAGSDVVERAREVVGVDLSVSRWSVGAGQQGHGMRMMTPAAEPDGVLTAGLMKPARVGKKDVSYNERCEDT